jgi:hypothetical protein
MPGKMSGMIKILNKNVKDVGKLKYNCKIIEEYN